MPYCDSVSGTHHSILTTFELPSTLIHKDLGLMVSRDLSWDTHYDYLALRAYKTIGLLKHNFSIQFLRKTTVYFISTFSIDLLLAEMEALFDKRYSQIRKHPMQGNQIHFEQLFNQLQV